LKAIRVFLSTVPIAAVICFFSAAPRTPHPAQTAPQKPAEKAPEKTQEKASEKSAPKTSPEIPAVIELLETHIRFETDGSRRKEVHALVKINDELGVRQFARLNFGFQRSFEQIEIPLVRITHKGGGTADVLPGAITDNPDPAVVNFPAYQDVRVKSVRILGLEPGDSLEYRVITTVTHPPLTPDFWVEHTFERSGVVSKEVFQVILPASTLSKTPVIVVKNLAVKKQLEARLYPEPGCGLCVRPDLGGPIDPSLLKLFDPKKQPTPPLDASPRPASAAPDEPPPPFESGKVQLLLKPSVSHVSMEKSGESGSAQISYTWHLSHAAAEPANGEDAAALEDVPDIQIGKNYQWPELSYQLFKALALPSPLPNEVVRLSQQLAVSVDKPIARVEQIYDFVSQKIKTVDLPLGATGFRPRPLGEIISSSYATQEDKFFLFLALAQAAGLDAQAALVGSSKKITALMATPTAFMHLLVGNSACNCWLDPALEVAPFGALPASYRGASALILGIDNGPLTDAPLSSMIVPILSGLPFASTQKVSIDATLDADGNLTAKAYYSMHGDNELLLRVAFHKTPKENWKNVAQLLALSDGFRGQVTNVTASDPYETHVPFTVEYEITQPKFVDWSKTPLRIPALLPVLGLPDPPQKPAPGTEATPINLGTPLDVEVSVTLHLPAGTSARIPTGTSVARDFATYTSQYSAKGATLGATRHLNFILEKIHTDRAADYDAFLRAVQNDESQVFTLERTDTTPVPAKKP
jgi:Domain of Unknown Function with PDB structure (DUF3857)